MDTRILIETLILKVAELENINKAFLNRINHLEAELATYKNKKNSNNSSIPPSKDENRPLQIKERIIQSVCVGTDETSVKVNGQKD